MKSSAGFFVALLISSHVFAVQDEPFLGKADCRVINPNPTPSSNESVTWSGGCKDGFADGNGVLQWYSEDKPGSRYEGDMARGRTNGLGIYVYKNGGRYEGEFKDSKRHGKGVLTNSNGSKLSANFEEGVVAGIVDFTYVDGAHYTGSWKNGKPEGLGKLRYIDGTIYEGEFKNGTPTGVNAVQMPPRKEYALKEEMTRTGTSIKHNAVTGSQLPYDKSYGELTLEQKNLFRSQYEKLEKGDEPPYPIGGTKAIALALSAAQQKISARGSLSFEVSVDSEGSASEVKVFGSLDPAMIKFASTVLMLQKYKPALCAGVPCAMVFPYRMTFTGY